ncbi:MAG: 1,4-dihydroxy-2-naphthoate polyprenyltransferase [Actinomycetota bacterium]
MTPLRVWLEASRPRTLPAGAVPVLVGTAAAQHVIAWRFVAALMVALALQIAVNFANDLFDAARGVDTPARVGPRRVVAAGLVTPHAMRRATIAALGVAAVAGFALAASVGYELLLVGAASIAAALAYSGGARPYGSAGLGEVFVFVFFGVVATAGSAYVQIGRVTAEALAASVPVGVLAAAILVANNLRDAEGDRRSGKMTLVVRFGTHGTRLLFRALFAVSFTALIGVVVAARSAWPLLALTAAPLARAPLELISSRQAPDLVRALVATARLELVLGVLLAAGLWLA